MYIYVYYICICIYVYIHIYIYNVYVCVCVCVCVRVCVCVNKFLYIRGSLNRFPDFFRIGTFIDNTCIKLESPSK